jgi:hypothetical protein
VATRFAGLHLICGCGPLTLTRSPLKRGQDLLSGVGRTLTARSSSFVIVTIRRWPSAETAPIVRSRTPHSRPSPSCSFVKSLTVSGVGGAAMWQISATGDDAALDAAR